MYEQHILTNPEGLYFVTSTVIDKVDIFIRKYYAGIPGLIKVELLVL